MAIYGRGDGIRTHDTLLTYIRFPSARLKPLGHPSKEIMDDYLPKSAYLSNFFFIFYTSAVKSIIVSN